MVVVPNIQLTSIERFKDYFASHAPKQDASIYPNEIFISCDPPITLWDRQYFDPYRTGNIFILILPIRKLRLGKQVYEAGSKLKIFLTLIPALSPYHLALEESWGDSSSTGVVKRESLSLSIVKLLDSHFLLPLSYPFLELEATRGTSKLVSRERYHMIPSLLRGL